MKNKQIKLFGIGVVLIFLILIIQPIHAYPVVILPPSYDWTGMPLAGICVDSDSSHVGFLDNGLGVYDRGDGVTYYFTRDGIVEILFVEQEGERPTSSTPTECMDGIAFEHVEEYVEAYGDFYEFEIREMNCWKYSSREGCQYVTCSVIFRMIPIDGSRAHTRSMSFRTSCEECGVSDV